MRKSLSIALAAVFGVLVVVSLIMAEATDPRDPNIERLRDKSAEVRASAAKVLGEQ